MERAMDGSAPSIIDLRAEAAKLTMFRGMTPWTTRAERKGTSAHLGSYREGMLFIGKGSGTGHWETHAEDELVCVLDGTATLDILLADGPQSFALGAGMFAIVPQHAWHRFRSADGRTSWSATMPGPHIELDIADPRDAGAKPVPGGRPPAIVDLGAEAAKLRMFRRTPQATAADRKGSVAELATYRDGLALAIKASGVDHWERHFAGDELVHVIDGAAMLDIVCDDGPPRSFALGAGTLAVIPRGAWHRLRSPAGATQFAVTPFPGESLEVDVDDPRTVARKPASAMP
jgi:mannose-6-phosphate isomerase-like protein (cupin superfamily)